MMNKKRLKIINFILCLAIIAFLLPIEALAMDSPEGGYIEEFPVPGNDDTVITNNYGTVNYAKTGGCISYNYYKINNLEGATVGENKDTGVIDTFINGRVENNYGTINKVSNTASVGTNTPNGVIKENFNNIDKNLGTIENQYSGIIAENYGNVGTIGASAKIEKLYEGTITENSGEVIIYPAPEGISTVIRIGTNKGSVKIEADTDNKSSVVIDKIEEGASLHVCEGADCTVVDNAGTIEIAEGGKCNITGSNTGYVSGDPVTPGEEYDYRLILDNVDPSDITFVDFFKKDGDNIYVMGGGQDSNVIVTYDKDKYFYPDAFEINGVIGISIVNSDYSVLDDEDKTFTIHFHTMGDFVPSSDGKHKQKCSGTWNGNECMATFNEESCSYGEWIIDSEAKVGVAGTKHRECSVCNGVENATIPAKPDNGNKKDDNGQGGNGQGGNENPSDTENGQENTSENTASKDTNPNKADTSQVINPTMADTAQVTNSTKSNKAQVTKSTQKNTFNSDLEGNIDNSDERDEEDETDSMNTDSVSGDNTYSGESSEETVDDMDMTEQETELTAVSENDGTVSSSSKSRIGIIVGVSACATVAATACFFIISKRKSKNRF